MTTNEREAWDRRWTDAMLVYRALHERPLRDDPKIASLARGAEAGDGQAMAALRDLVWQFEEDHNLPVRPGTGSARYCFSCGAKSTPRALFCGACGASLNPQPSQLVAGAAYLLNELPALERQGVIAEAALAVLRRRYEETLRGLGAPLPAPESSLETSRGEDILASAPGVAGVPEVNGAAVSTAVPSPPPGPSLAERAPNLLLFMGAFLVLMATLFLYAGYISAAFDSPETARDAATAFILGLLTVFMAGFIVAGWSSRRSKRIATAGATFLVIGALLSPVNLFAWYIFTVGPVFASSVSSDLFWFVGSAYLTLFYGALAVLGLGRLYAWLTGLALLSTWIGGLLTFDVAVEWAPMPFLLLSLALSAWPRLRSERLRETFARSTAPFARVVAGGALAFSIATHLATGTHSLAVHHWSLPIAIAVGALFYGLPV